MDVTQAPVQAMTAGDLMHRDVVVVPRQMSLRRAARLMHEARSREAAVVDEEGRCVGVLSPENVLHWIEAGCPEVVLGPVDVCPYQVRGRLLAGGEAVICILARGSCPYQASYPGLGGRSTGVCMRPENTDSPFGAAPCYITMEPITVRAETPLPELVRQIIESQTDRVFVLDACRRPIGIVSATDVLSVSASTAGEDADAEF